MLREQIVAIRAGAAAQVAMADAILRAMEPAPQSAPPSVCAHPAEQRISASRMGAPDAWRCACGAEGEG